MIEVLARSKDERDTALESARKTLECEGQETRELPDQPSMPVAFEANLLATPQRSKRVVLDGDDIYSVQMQAFRHQSQDDHILSLLEEYTRLEKSLVEEIRSEAYDITQRFRMTLEEQVCNAHDHQRQLVKSTWQKGSSTLQVEETACEKPAVSLTVPASARPASPRVQSMPGFLGSEVQPLEYNFQFPEATDLADHDKSQSSAYDNRIRIKTVGSQTRRRRVASDEHILPISSDEYNAIGSAPGKYQSEQLVKLHEHKHPGPEPLSRPESPPAKLHEAPKVTNVDKRIEGNLASSSQQTPLIAQNVPSTDGSDKQHVYPQIPHQKPSSSMKQWSTSSITPPSSHRRRLIKAKARLDMRSKSTSQSLSSTTVSGKRAYFRQNCLLPFRLRSTRASASVADRPTSPSQATASPTFTESEEALMPFPSGGYKEPYSIPASRLNGPSKRTHYKSEQEKHAYRDRLTRVGKELDGDRSDQKEVEEDIVEKYLKDWTRLRD